MRLRRFESDIEGHAEASLLCSVSLKDPCGALKIWQGCDLEFLLEVTSLGSGVCGSGRMRQGTGDHLDSS